MANIWEKAILILTGNLNSGHTHLITTVNIYLHFLFTDPELWIYGVITILINWIPGVIASIHLISNQRHQVGPIKTLVYCSKFQTCNIHYLVSNKNVVIGVFVPIKVNLEFSFSFACFSFLDLDPNIYSGFKLEINFLYQYWVFLNNCVNFGFFSAITDC